MRWLTGGIIVAVQAAAWGASITTEPFTATMNGWTNETARVWRWTNAFACAAVVMPAQGIPTPESATLLGTNNSSAGSFTGNYKAVGASLIGFRFRPEQEVPSDLTLSLVFTNRTYTRSLEELIPVNGTGVWYSFAVSLASREAGQWGESIAGTEQDFQNALENIRTVKVRVLRNSINRQVYYIDDFFLGTLFEATSVEMLPGEQVALSWDALRTGEVYTVESSTNLLQGAAWAVATNFVATGGTYAITLPAFTNGTALHYRLMQ